MIARTSLKTICARSTLNRVTCTKRFSSSIKNNNNDKDNVKELSASTQQQQEQQKELTNSSSQTAAAAAPDNNATSFMPVVNIPVAELAHSAFYSLHRPLLGLSSPKPFLVADSSLIGQIIKKEQDPQYDEEAVLQYMSTLKPFEPPTISVVAEPAKSTTTTLTVEVDPSYFLNHDNNHDEIADYLNAMQEKLDLLYGERDQKRISSFISKRKAATTTTTRRLRKRSSKGFFEKN